jgi:PDZ domain-containing secreted protein
VHAIGGVQQKTVGAIEAGADTFLVPAGDNVTDARAAAHGRIHVIGVTSFTQALAVIRRLPPG